ncbi:hypothetical protein ACFRCI_46140 [Streptomyces sp. NPDC056638]|uniref:hypothetical protein n=1 Tax=Streptomyces sp. NPDC056638 TaxID=3345887 RepID=UPI0036AF10F8
MADSKLMRRWLEETPGLELYCFVDSIAGVGLARAAMEGVHNPLRVLVDVGAQGGRTGVCGSAAAYEVATAAQASPGLLLAGVAGYESIRPNRHDAATTADVDAHCQEAVVLFRSLTPLFQTTQHVFSMGGSAFPDRSDPRRINAVLH